MKAGGWRLEAGARQEPSSEPNLQPPTSNLYTPKPVRVGCSGSVPASINGKKVEAIREEWLVEDRWWSEEPLRRHYLELVLESGRCLVVYRDLETGRWFEQR